MGRVLRESAGGVVYHVLNRRVLGLPLFEDAGDYRAFLRVLDEALQRDDAPRRYAFCLMPNHWHPLVEPGKDAGENQPDTSGSPPHALNRITPRRLGFRSGRADRGC